MAAVNSAKGLVVPNIKAVQSQSVFEIAGELERLVALAQEGTLPADDLADGTHAHPQNCSPLGHSFKTNLLTHDGGFGGRDICAVEHWRDWRDICDPGGDDTAGGDWCAGQATDAAEV